MTVMAKAVIVSALPYGGEIELCAGDLLIACDLGLERCKEKSLVPDLVIGDFDSLGFVPDVKDLIKLPVKKDDTDTGYAIEYAIKNGYKEIAVYGALGGHLDLTLASVQLLAGAAKRGIKARFYAEDCVVTAVTDGAVILPGSDKRFSLFAVDDCAGVTIEGALYELQNAPLSPFMPLGVSNRQKGETRIAVKSGTLIVVKYK